MNVTKTSIQVSARRLVAISEARRAARDGRIRQVRQGAQLSQSEFGDALGVQAATVSRWENGQRLPRGNVAERLTHLLREIEAASRTELPEMREAGFTASEPRGDEDVDEQASRVS